MRGVNHINFIGTWPGKALLLRGGLGSSQKVLGANFYVCRSYRGKAGTEGEGSFCLPPPEHSE